MKLIYNYTFNQLVEILIENGYKKYRASQVWDWLYDKKVDSFESMKNLPKDLLDYLAANYTFSSLDLIQRQVSNDGTNKFLYKLKDNNLIESVVMKHHYGNSICISTQIGCNIGCSFCASGQLKRIRNLEVGEMVLQVLESERQLGQKIDSVVLMGIGEPFDNFSNVVNLLQILNDQKGFNIGARRLTVSTSGIVPKIYEFADLKLQVNLAISLHAATDEVRSKLMRINQVYPVKELIDAVKYYLEKTNRRVTIEYILINGVNDSENDAVALVNLLKGINVYINLIPYNTVIGTSYERSSEKIMKQFLHCLKRGGLDVTLRKEQGHDINAACGQLRSIQEKKK
ncbi:MAG: 23S rRNA (adenine(2503)-C(2))-methyltransferase RlmN [Acholeplasmataceae bacterium]|jgi:23S rRNA (adenine2503-C2)-methyltransferase